MSIPTPASSDLRALTTRYAALSSLGVLSLIRTGQQSEWRALGNQMTAAFPNFPDHFIQVRPHRTYFGNLPPAMNFPLSLALQGPNKELQQIHLSDHHHDRLYIRLDDLKFGTTEYADHLVEAAYQTLADDPDKQSAPIVGKPVINSQFVLVQGGEYLIAAQDRGDTHLLVSLTQANGSPGLVSERNDVGIVLPKPPRNRTDFLQRWLTTQNGADAIRTIRQYSAHPQLLGTFTDLIEFSSHPHAPHILLFLEMVCRHGFCRSGRPLNPNETTVAVVGFGDETETIAALLNLGYRVVAVEDFSSGPTTTSKTSFQSSEFRAKVAQNAPIDRLQVFDFRDPELPVGSAHVVLSAAVVDEAFFTIASMAAPGGVIALTDSGQLDARRINFQVDSADSFIHEGGKHGLVFEPVYSDLIFGEGALRSQFWHPRGQTSYIVRKSP